MAITKQENSEYDALPFHRKYRPNTLSRYIGNAKVKETALKALESGKRPQVILLWGDSGCGKTTLARLLAKEYSCTDRDPVNGACGVCPNCQGIDDYIATGKTDVVTNIQEVNIAAQSGKHDLDSVMEDMEIPSFGDEWKIYIFDECHEASSGQQNMLLKVAEEPPENVLMIFCTTNPEKMLDTLRNRCQLKLHITKPTVKELAGLLRTVCSSEQVEYDQKGLEFIANRGELTIRTALTNLQQVVTEVNSAKFDEVVKVFESVAQTTIIDFFRALKRRDTLRFVTILSDVKGKMDLPVFLAELKGFVKRGIYTINSIQQDGVSDSELSVYRDLFGDLGVAEVCSLINKLLSFNTNNLELELLLWGYSGLKAETISSEQKTDFVIPLEKEVALETQNANEVIQKKEADEYQQGIENAEAMMQDASIEAIMQFGGVVVDNP